MALPATDTFTGTNNDPLGGSWTDIFNSFRIWGNRAQGTVGPSAAFHNVETYNNNQYAQCKVYNDGNYICGPVVRASASGGYCAAAFGSEFRIYLLDGSGFSTLLLNYDNGGLGVSYSDGDLVRIEANGTTIKGLVNGVQWGTDVTDATFASGKAGILSYDTSAVDDFEGGNLAAGGTARQRLVNGGLTRGRLIG